MNSSIFEKDIEKSSILKCYTSILTEKKNIYINPKEAVTIVTSTSTKIGYSGNNKFTPDHKVFNQKKKISSVSDRAQDDQ